MKVAFVVEHYPRLYHTFIRHEIAGLVERGARVSVFSLFRDPMSLRTDLRAPEVAHSVTYVEDHVGGRYPFLARAALRRESRLARLGHGVHRVVERALFDGAGASEKYKTDLRWVSHGLDAVASMIASGGFDVIHAGFGNKSATAAMLLSRATGVPFTFETHAYDLYVDFKFADEKIREARRIFTISHYNREHLVREYQCPAEKIEVVRVPFNKAQCDSQASVERDPELVVSVGRLHPIKGFAYALEAMKSIVGRRPVRYVIVGGGPLDKELRRRIRQLGLEEHIEMRGDASNAEALALVNRAAVFLLPSVIGANGDRDGVPTSLLEAMYLGTPVVSSRVSGIPELVENGISGFLVDPKDVAGIAHSVERLLDDEALRSAMGRAARERVRTGFYREDSAETLLRCWQAERVRESDGDRRPAYRSRVAGGASVPGDGTKAGLRKVTER